MTRALPFGHGARYIASSVFVPSTSEAEFRPPVALMPVALAVTGHDMSGAGGSAVGGAMIRTKGELRKAILKAETMASVLRTPGFTKMGAGERREIATLLDGLAGASRRLFGNAPLPDTAPDLHDAAHEDDDGHGDLFGVPV